MALGDSVFTPEFEQAFYSLYDKLERQRFKPTLDFLNHNLKTLLDAKFGVSPRLRLRVEPGRIKSANRLLLKAQLPKYRDKIRKPEDIFVEIRDIVGTRISCNTLNDVYAVAHEIKTVANSQIVNCPLVKQHEDYEDDYIKNPKESGYRALSLLVGIPVAIGDHTEHVTCEIQIRTLLQHAWGELTHEDTYKPEMKIPELIVILSKRLANTLAVLDEIAQDIRNELDKLEIEQAAPIPLPEPASTTKPVASQVDAVAAATEQEAAVPSEPVPLPPTPSLTVQTIQNAFQAVLSRKPDVSESVFDGLLTGFLEAGVLSAHDVEKALRIMQTSIEALESKYEGVELSDYGRLLYAPSFWLDPNQGMDQIRAALDQAEEKKLQFENTYPPGREVLGTVVHVAPNYALVQLPEGDTGIIHVTEMKASPDDYVAVHEVVHEGDTVRVQILNSNELTKRIELRLLQPEAPKRQPRW
jgi:ppGpp synthetase/RelA/SpoT-type nucleotidyltranferase